MVEGSPEKLRGVERLESSLGVEEISLREEKEAPTGEDMSLDMEIKAFEENSIQHKEARKEKEVKDRKIGKSQIDWSKVSDFSELRVW